MASDPQKASIKAIITRRLEEALAPESLEVVDESHLHIGHVGALEHVSINRIPVNRKNMQRNKDLEHGFDSIKTNRAPAWQEGAAPADGARIVDEDFGAQSHFRIRLRATALAGMSRLARHKRIHAVLGADVFTTIHALAIEVLET